MSWVRKNPVFAASLLGLGLVVLAEGGLLSERWTAARAVRKRLEGVSRELRALAAVHPAPTPESTARIEADLARTTEVLAELRAELRLPGPDAAQVRDALIPARRPDAFFDLAGFVEAMRTRAGEAGVRLKPDERFGFSSYANEAPDSAQIAAVFRDRVRVQSLVEALLDARPHELLSIQRGRAPEKPDAGRGGKTGGPVGGRSPGAAVMDYFAIDPRISMRVPGITETTAFRLSFTGHTATLRNLLNKLGESELPVVVRSVEVAPVDRRREDPLAGRTGAPPIVESSWSRFAVTVEFVELTPRPAPAF